MSGGMIYQSTSASPFLPASSSPTQPTVSRAQLLQKHPWLGLHPSATAISQVDVCDACAQIKWDQLPSVTAEGAVPHREYGDIIASSSTCQVCRVIVYAVQWQRERILSDVGSGDKPYLWGSQWITGPVPEISQDTRIWLFGAWKAAGPSMPPHCLFGLGCMMAAKDVERLRPRDADGAMEKTTFIPNASVRICAGFGDAIGNIVPGHVRSADARHAANFDLAKRWMKICRDQHDCESRNASLPARVLEISGDGGTMTVRLFETESQISSYTALSHCWGKGRPLITTTQNINELKTNIPLDSLPKTFSDAVVITHTLGLRYLWVDRLCIIQDSPEDWAVQSMRMASIYADANITICASGSISDEDGVFIPRSTVYQPLDNDTGVRDTRFSAMAAATVSLSSGQTSRLTFFPQRITDGGLGTLGNPLDPVTSDPLNLRGWVVQERILSPRKLMYGRDQMYWECERSLYSEDDSRGKPSTALIEQIVDRERNQTGRARRKSGWPKLVTAYSEGRLTYLSDKFPALAGLASTIGEGTSAQYYAEVWSSHLWQDLLWHAHTEPEATPFGFSSVEDFEAYLQRYPDNNSTPGSDRTNPWLEVLEKWRWVVTPGCPPLPHDTEVGTIRHNDDMGEISKTGFTLKRPTAYVAPSWSFASVDAPVKYTYHEDAGLDVVANCINIQTELPGPNKYGHVKSGSLTIRGMLLPLTKPPAGTKTFFFGSKVCVDIPEYHFGGSEIENVFLDIKPVFPCWALMVGLKSAILVVPEEDADEDLRFGLEHHEGTWIRVGASHAMYGFEKFFTKADKSRWVREITIV
ncbi:uncharacterized protein LTR77_001038 [Saxophila tyrrhenica]|uniref:Heterokaryon incompatibility domain-containing protein n=1 Tax=Saxophila tyrrhenica TaxID=1690608 RepID=A0AAV9PU96_9PEZI|nr:hypothetical protein LTR77_001038 [Saxophila tyrrhenica]